MSSTNATIEYYDNTGNQCERTKDFVAPIGGGRLGIFIDDDAYTEPYEIVNMASPSFISVKWINTTTDRIYQKNMR